MAFPPSAAHVEYENLGSDGQATRKGRRSRPSRARGLRTSTGCLTCRRRRVKCDEARPHCRNCGKSDRACEYADPISPSPSLPFVPDEYEDGSAYRHGEATEPHPRNADPQTRYADPHHRLADPQVRSRDFNLGPATADPVQSYAAHSVTSNTVPNGEGHLGVTAMPTWPSSLLPTNQADEHPQLHDSPDTVASDILLSSLYSHDLAALDSLHPVGIAPFDWYDLLAADAIDNLQRHKLTNDEAFRDFDEACLSRRRSPAPEYLGHDSARSNTGVFEGGHTGIPSPPSEPWNSPTRIALDAEELVYFHHYVDVVGPILDLSDPDKHFTNTVPHLALHNEGLLKALLAVGGRHKALHASRGRYSRISVSNQSDVDSPRSTMGGPSSEVQMLQKATKYYYVTLSYLSQTLLYPSYTQSLEILATAIMISTYEMFDAYEASNSGNWERHLQGGFWIQRSQDNNGESADGLRRAVWWAWLRQDIWAAFRQGRPAMTIWRPKKSLAELNPDELATRVIYIAAKCVQFAASDKESDVNAHITVGRKLLKALEDWKRILPPSFEPISGDSLPLRSPSIYSSPGQNNAPRSEFTSIWIHPPQYAAAIQTYHFARIIVLLHQTSTGGPAAYRAKEKMLSESVDMICGITLAEQSRNLPSAFVSFQALFVAGLCIRTSEKQSALLQILEETLEASRFPPTAVINDWMEIWNGHG